jgi:hypothetical protein
MSFRDFLRLKKEVLEAYQLYLDELEDFRWHQYFSMEEGSSHEDASGQIQLLGYRRLKGGKTLIPSSEWPEALKGLTQEDIEILKL